MDEVIDDLREQPKYRFNGLFKSLWFIYGFMAFVGYLLKIMHWPGADFNLISGLAGLSGHSIVYILYKTEDKKYKRFGYIFPLLLFIKAFTIYRYNTGIMLVYLGFIATAFLIGYLIRK